MADEQPAAAENTPAKQVALRKIYIKDMSFESPSAPGIFNRGEFRPVTNLNIRTAQAKVDETLYEMTLTLTLDAKMNDETAFLVEIQQAGVFHIDGYNEQEIGVILGTFCPATLFPYAREAISGAVQRGGFPDFLLQPIDFDSLFARTQQERAKQAEAQAASEETH
ncbi:MAG: protein-export chaperone SecB [Pseudomonadota bacterium]